ncbi:TonB-dependent receptor, partial [Sphingomonas sp.]|uniref:TonB-dependent receptor domain-containing protein n=1 Tax=Sphingomonas sp. TaxID=28214 RepID=UPI0025FF569F
NGTGTSRGSGIEAEGEWRISPRFRLSANYAYQSATQPGPLAGAQVREVRRSKHSGSVALDGSSGRWSYGVGVAYTGSRIDTDFDAYPARTVSLHPYWLADARLAYRVSRTVELFVRTANAFDAHYEDVIGYRTQGRSLHAGIRLAGR